MDQARVNPRALSGVGRHQRTIRDDVDQPGDSVRALEQGLDRGSLKWISFRAGNLHPVPNICRCIPGVQWCQVIAGCDSLRQLPQTSSLQHLAQFRLTQQDDLKELFFAGFQVGEQTNLFQGLRRQILGFINHHHDTLPVLVRVQQVSGQPVDQFLGATVDVRGRYLEFLTDGRQQLHGRNQRVQYQRNVRVFRNLLQQAAAKRGFSRAHFACQLNKASTAPLADAEQQVRECVAMTVAEVDKCRVRRDRKRRFIQAKIVQIHSGNA